MNIKSTCFGVALLLITCLSIEAADDSKQFPCLESGCTDSCTDDSTSALIEATKILEERAAVEPDNLTLARELVLAYQSLATHFKKNRQYKQSDDVVRQAQMTIESTVARLTLNSLIDLIKERDDWAIAAANRLGELGEDGSPAIPVFSVVLHDRPGGTSPWKLKPAVACALGRIGPLAVAVLLKAASIPDTQQQALAVEALAMTEKHPKEAAQAIRDSLRDPEPAVRRAAVLALVRLFEESAVLDDVQARLKDNDSGVRLAAIYVLGANGTKANVAIPALIDATCDKNSDAQLATLQNGPPFDSVEANQQDRTTLKVGSKDWPQWGGSRQRDNTPQGVNIPTDWDVKSGKHIKWTAKLGSETYGNPSVANGKIFIGTNNGNGYLARYPATVDLGVMFCFDDATGKFLWQYSSPKLPTGRVHDWPQQGMPSTPVVDGHRLWATTNRCEVVCLDVEGFCDNENDGPFRDETNENTDEADIVWRFDMMKELGVSPHNLSNCSILMVEYTLFVCTSNGVDDGHMEVAAPEAPSFIALDRSNGKVLWTDNSPGRNILHAQWASASYGVLGGQPQVLFPGGDGWLYSFDPQGDGRGNPKILWKFDCNFKESKYFLSGQATRNSLIAFACIYDGLVYLATGEDPEHAEASGQLWCINPAKKLDGSDVSSQLVVDVDGMTVPHRRLCAADPSKGERVIQNTQSAVVWQYSQFDGDADGKIDFEEQFHRTLGTAVIKDYILYIADLSGLFHCLNAKTGDVYWRYDLFAATWGSALLVDGKVYISDEDGDVAIFRHSVDHNPLAGKTIPIAENNINSRIYSTPVVANNVLYIATRNLLYAIESSQ